LGFLRRLPLFRSGSSPGNAALARPILPVRMDRRGLGDEDLRHGDGRLRQGEGGQLYPCQVHHVPFPRRFPIAGGDLLGEGAQQVQVGVHAGVAERRRDEIAVERLLPGDLLSDDVPRLGLDPRIGQRVHLHRPRLPKAEDPADGLGERDDSIDGLVGDHGLEHHQV